MYAGGSGGRCSFADLGKSLDSSCAMHWTVDPWDGKGVSGVAGATGTRKEEGFATGPRVESRWSADESSSRFHAICDIAVRPGVVGAIHRNQINQHITSSPRTPPGSAQSSLRLHP